jgi:hypothetical protein
MLTMLLAKAIGLYLVVGGVALIVKQKELRQAERHFKSEGMLRFSLGMILLMLGLVYVVGYNDFTSYITTFLTFFGWLVLLKGLVVLFIEGGSLDALIKKWNRKEVYYASGSVMIILGAYLAGFGFGFVW